MRRFICLLMALCCLIPAAQAATGLTIIPHAGGFDFDFTLNDTWVRLHYKTAAEQGVKTLYAADGHFAGSMELRVRSGGKVTVTVEDLALRTVAKKTVTLPAAEDYAAPRGKTGAKVTQLTLWETPSGFRYSFLAPGTDYMLLYFRTVQEEACFPVYPANADGLYEGEVVSGLTYARTLFKVQVRSGNGAIKREGEVRKGYEAPEAPAQGTGRLSSVVVCIDPGHHENHQNFKEERGPGLTGSVVNTGGMAQGKTTLRREAIVTLETGMILRDLLLAEGATVIMTRSAPGDFITNRGRCDVAEAAGAQIMLRLHCNLVSNANTTGIQVYAPLNSTYARAVASPAEYRAAGEAFLNEMKKSVGLPLTDRSGRVTLNDSYVGNNWAKMLCFLVEMGYMSNPGEDIRLATPEYQTMLAQGMVEGVYQVALLRGWIGN